MADLVPEKLVQLKKAYSIVFKSEEGKKVMADLEKVCFETGTTLHELPHIMSFQEGHRVVLMHIKNRMRLDHVMESQQQEENTNE